ncbi:hypothetical protein AUR04nite_30350 [Glutamicibacter uratoxydans]|uniref:Uncharacterized protein n=1 Tax=Glutamicibacter uratoxydans TaxID=43667 RepID=A0A4Y4DS70_GLUUR|nr:hypothetical protein [Glutamicibacter uratoxydans]GED07503.1 hypothetical protein AUR04nite_30350 [Glutamicibacter uratoxydans]
MILKRILFWSFGIAVLGFLMFMNLQPDDSPWRAFGPWIYWALAGLFVVAAVVRLILGQDRHKTHYLVGPMASAGQTYGSLVMGSADVGASTAFTDKSLSALTPNTELTVDNKPPEGFVFKQPADVRRKLNGDK